MSLTFFHSIILCSPFTYLYFLLPYLYYFSSSLYLISFQGYLISFFLLISLLVFLSFFIPSFYFSCCVHYLQFRRYHQILSKAVLFTCLFCLLVIKRHFLASQASVDFIINLRTGELWKEEFITKMHQLHQIFNSVLRIIIFMTQIIFKIKYACQLQCIQNMTEIFIFFQVS